MAHFEDADVAGADFRGADIHRSTLHKSKDWHAALLDLSQYEELLRKAGLPQDLEVLAARSAAGEPLNVWQYVALIKAARNFEAAELIHEQMRAAGVVPNGHVFNTLMDKADDFGLATSLMNLAKAHGIEVDEAMVTTLMSHSRSFEEAREVFDTYSPPNGFETTFPFNTLISRARSKDLAVALTVMEMMAEQNVRPDQVTINAALNTQWSPRTGKFRQAAHLVREAINWGVQLRDDDLAALVRRAQTEADVEHALELAALAKVQPGVHVSNAVISRASTFHGALELFQRMLAQNIRPDRHTAYALLTASHTEFDVLEALAQMHEQGLSYDEEVVRRMVQKAPDVSRARALVLKIKASGGGLADVVRGLAIIWLAGNDTREWLNRLVPDLRPRRRTKFNRRHRRQRAPSKRDVGFSD